MKQPRLLMIDNYDSFTYNLVQYFAQLGAHIDVVRNDKITADDALKKDIDGIIISPGPATPNDAGICLELTQKAHDSDMPLFTVCLGHQTVGQVFGGTVIRAPSPMHGKVSNIIHSGKGVFAGLPSPFEATRYHSLIIDPDTLPNCLEATAHTEDGIIMGVQHKSKPIHGVQFHPESIATQHGHDLLHNFLKML